jgi:hypothetical protein
MIPRAHIAEWRDNVPWKFDYQVEQGLVIERALVELFSDPFIVENLAFVEARPCTNSILVRSLDIQKT